MSTIEYISHREDLAANIRRLRLSRGYSMRTFSLMIGISKTHLCNLETAQASPTFDMLERIAAGLGINVAELVRF